MSSGHSIHRGDLLPAGILDIAEDPGVFCDLVRRSPDALLGGFWKIDAHLDGGGKFRGTGFLAGIDAEPRFAASWKFYFIRWPPRGRRETIVVKSVSDMHGMCEANLQMTGQEDIVFKLKVMMGPAYCSPKLLPRLFANIRELHAKGHLKVDWDQMLEQLPRSPEPESNWGLVVGFVREMSQRALLR